MVQGARAPLNLNGKRLQKSVSSEKGAIGGWEWQANGYVHSSYGVCRRTQSQDDANNVDVASAKVSEVTPSFGGSFNAMPRSVISGMI
jgi:hypothetical protein